MKRWINLAILALVVGSNLATWPSAQADEDEGGPLIATPQRVFTDNGVTYVKLDTDTQKAIGLQTKTLKPAHYRASLRAYGQVINLSALLRSYQQLASAQAKASQSRAQLDASQAEYRRLNSLYRDHQNASKKAVQTARATWQSDQASAQAAEGQKFAVTSDLEARWGASITRWMIKDSRSFQRLANGKSRLLKLTLPLGKAPANPLRSAQLLLANGTTAAASLISPAPTTEPDLQGQSYYFLATSQVKHLNYGLRVTGLMSYGPQHRGAVVPNAAVVWSQGSAWAYVKMGDERFERKPVRTDTPVPAGWFQAGGLSPGNQVVTQGAAVLLSVQALAGGPKGSASEDGDGD